MPTIKKASAPPPPVQLKRKISVAGAKKGPSTRKKPIESLIYGEEIFNPLIKKEREIVVSFYPFTQNNLRISTEGKFIIEKFQHYIVEDVEEGLLPLEELVKKSSETHWNLYYFNEPLILNAIPEIDKFKDFAYIIDTEKCEIFKDFSNQSELEEKVIALVRAEYFVERQNKIKEIDQAITEKLDLEREEREKEDNEEESNSSG